MKKIFTLLLIISATSLCAQFGLRAKYSNNNYTDWTEAIEDAGGVEPFSSQWEIGVDYWFRLKNKRVEFYPELAYSQTKTEQPNLPFNEMSLNSFMFNVNVNIYPLDFTGDCDCPTFSKQGPGIQKGFFIFLSPGIAYNQYVFEGSTLETNDVNYSVGAGIGLDLGISDLVTITPFVGYHRSFNTTWENFNCGLNELGGDCSENQDTGLSQIKVGLRIGFRPDYGR